LKRELPLFPRRVGIVTSPTGAAIRDILHVISRRTRTVDLVLSPARVQGEGTGLEIARAIELLNELHARAAEEGRDDERVDVIIVGRGGGSAEDLWAFNDEGLARAIRASAIPVISAVGHETDFTIADFAADLRAPTPSAAAEIVAAREDEMADAVHDLTRDLVQAVRLRIMEGRTRVQEAAMSQGFDDVRERLRDSIAAVDEARHRLETSMMRAAQRAHRRAEAVVRRLQPMRLGARIARGRTRFNVACAERDAAIAARLEDARARLSVTMASLDALSPLAVLQRGYALAQDERGRLLTDASATRAGEPVHLRLARGRIIARVEQTEKS
ncbi:MAG: exodeoxyribonuclease VII large subunit, partial [Pyrinomonadaceae bacterium]|nr:exodeoxyribonuclease VII large subunit [Pyrinomonadaceae bacterium]